MTKRLLRIEELSLTLDEDETILSHKIAKLLAVPKNQILSIQILKKAIDSRNKSNILFVYALLVDLGDNEGFFVAFNHPKNEKMITRHRIKLSFPYHYELPAPVFKTGTAPRLSEHKRPVVVGTGPSGLFAGLLLAHAGLNPIILERGSEIIKRVKDVNTFFEQGILDPESNVQFGEGGAGTFSDGKLYTLVNDPRSQFIFETLVQAGAPKEIISSARPHIGTDKLRGVVKNLREKIISLGGEFHFDSKMIDIEINHHHVEAILTSDGKRYETDTLVFGVGHSARDTYEMLYHKGFEMEQKPFAVGVRIEHPREMINISQFGGACHHIKLPTANYKLVSHHEQARSVYTFCMCPGGYVVGASSEARHLTVNGMSEYAQDSINSNSALLVSVLPGDFGSDHPLAGIEFQRYWEAKAFEAGGQNYYAPAQLVGDFLAKKPSTKLGVIKSTYRPGIRLTNLHDCLPDFVCEALMQALPVFERKIAGFARKDALLIALEARSSAVVRIKRDASGESNIGGCYPVGEGAGYAGGITSSALDGMMIAESIIQKKRGGE